MKQLLITIAAVVLVGCGESDHQHSHDHSHADGDHDVHRVAAKEAEEESGISTLELVSKDIFDIDIHKIPTQGDVPAHLHYDARFLFRTTDNEKYEVSNESIELEALFNPLSKDSSNLPFVPDFTEPLNIAKDSF